MSSFDSLDPSDIYALCHDAVTQDNVDLIKKALPWVDKQDGTSLLEASAQAGAAQTFHFLARELFPVSFLSRSLPFLCSAVKADHSSILENFIPELKTNSLCFSRVFVEIIRQNAEKCLSLSFSHVENHTLATGLLEILAQGDTANNEVCNQIVNKLQPVEVMSVIVSHIASSRIDVGLNRNEHTDFLDSFLYDLNQETFSMVYPKVHRLAKNGILPQMSARYARQNLLAGIGNPTVDQKPAVFSRKL